MQFDLVLDY